jgi:hypothetical protein
MKLLIENWRSYTASILNEDLLIESSEDAYLTVKKRAAKLLKGWAYDNAPDYYNTIEANIQSAIKDRLDDGVSQETLNDYTNAWEIGGVVIANLLNDRSTPSDVTDKQLAISLLWNYKQLVIGSIVDLDHFLNTIVKFLAQNRYDIFVAFSGKLLQIPKLSDFRLNFVYAYMSDDDDESDIKRFKLIENFFHWNNFIRNGKRDLNSVVDYDELIELVKEAEPKYKAWQEKQEQADAEKGKEVLLDNKSWQVIAIHNKGAACQLGKGTEWCTAAPGLNYFKTYYQPDDPLFFILDKSDGERYQFHFGTKQFMDKQDNDLYPSRYHVGDEIMKVLKKVIPEKYEIARNFLDEFEEK